MKTIILDKDHVVSERTPGNWHIYCDNWLPTNEAYEKCKFLKFKNYPEIIDFFNFAIGTHEAVN